jgi:hypothetical protein
LVVSALIGALTLTGTAIYLLRDVQENSTPARSSRVVAAAGRDVANLRRVADAAPQARPAMATAADRSADAATSNLDDRAAPEPPSTDEVRDHLETAFAAERTVASNPGRAYGVEQAVHAALPVGSSLRSVQCRGALCRIETVHTSIEEFHGFIRRAFQTPESKIANTPVFAGPLASAAPGKPLIVVAYLGSEGGMLPMQCEANATSPNRLALVDQADRGGATGAVADHALFLRRAEGEHRRAWAVELTAVGLHVIDGDGRVVARRAGAGDR